MKNCESSTYCSSRCDKNVYLQRHKNDHHDEDILTECYFVILLLFSELEAYSSIISAFRAQGELSRWVDRFWN